MPNHITSILKVSGETNRVKEMFSDIYGGMDERGDDICIDFNKILPMPESLNIECVSNSTKGMEIITQFRDECAAIAKVHMYSSDENRNTAVADLIKRQSFLRHLNS